MDRKLILIAATKNKHKIEEFRGIFSSVSTGSLEVLSEEEAVRRYDVESAAEYVPPEETGKTFAANAFLKAAGIYRFLKVPLRKFSDADILMTRQLYDMAQVLEITLRDHIIVAGDDFVSLAQSGILTAV